MASDGRSTLLPCFQFLNRGILAIREHRVDALHDHVVNLAILFKRDFPQRLIDGIRDVDRTVNDIRPLAPSCGRYRGDRTGTGLALLGLPRPDWRASYPLPASWFYSVTVS
jgi:hypothetical protein